MWARNKNPHNKIRKQLFPELNSHIVYSFAPSSTLWKRIIDFYIFLYFPLVNTRRSMCYGASENSWLSVWNYVYFKSVLLGAKCKLRCKLCPRAEWFWSCRFSTKRVFPSNVNKTRCLWTFNWKRNNMIQNNLITSFCTSFEENKHEVFVRR